MIHVRPYVADDHQFVLSGWSASMRSSPDLPLVPMLGYAQRMHPILEEYIAHVPIVVAHGETGVLYGFLAGDAEPYTAVIRKRRRRLEGYVYYLYVAAPFRGPRWGVADALFAAAHIDPRKPFGYAVETPAAARLRARYPGAEYEAFKARYLTMETSHG